VTSFATQIGSLATTTASIATTTTAVTTTNATISTATATSTAWTTFRAAAAVTTTNITAVANASTTTTAANLTQIIQELVNAGLIHDETSIAFFKAAMVVVGNIGGVGQLCQIRGNRVQSPLSLHLHHHHRRQQALAF
jgi:hypothetical protein